MMRINRSVLIVATLAMVCGVRADIPSVSLTIPAPVPGGEEKCVKAVAEKATCAAVSEVGSLLVMGVAPMGVAPPGGAVPLVDGALLAFALDASGAVVKPAEPVKLPLTKPASLAAFKLVPTAVYAHPRLPVVYVWQDVNPAESAPQAHAPPDVVQRDLDHLLTYKVNGPTLELVKATARGEWFTPGFNIAHLNSDASPTVVAKDDRLFLPHIQRPNPDAKGTSDKYTQMFGYATLDENGMPVMDATGALALTSIVDPSNYVHVDRPMGTLPISKQVVLIGGHMQVTSLDFKSRYTVGIYTYGSHSVRSTGNAKYPRFFSAGLNTSYVYSIEHVDGAFTMMPQCATVTGLSVLSYPVLDTKSNRLLVGGASGLHMIAMNEAGVFSGTQQHAATPNQVRAVAYSGKFDRIYIPVDKLP
jgi:hypothetical protein